MLKRKHTCISEGNVHSRQLAKHLIFDKIQKITIRLQSRLRVFT